MIARDSEKWFQVFRINKGSSDGVAVDMNVVADGGLVGIVTDVGAIMQPCVQLLTIPAV